MKGKRLSDLHERPMIGSYDLSTTKFLIYWRQFWNVVYTINTVGTYILMLVGICMTTYYAVFNFDFVRGLGLGLFTLLMIKCNFASPKSGAKGGVYK